MLSVKVSGSYRKTKKFLMKAQKVSIDDVLNKYGRLGVDALKKATPRDTGKTADSWGYKITKQSNGIKLSWTNSNRNNGVPIAILIQYGHGTATGGYVQGRDYINPALRPVFDKLANDAWKEVTEL